MYSENDECSEILPMRNISLNPVVRRYNVYSIY